MQFKINIIVLTIFFALTNPSLRVEARSESSIEFDIKKVEYTLPYPGLLPDNPFAIIKNIRDDILVFTIRDNEKKARFILSLSDKHAAYALGLINKGKDNLAIKEIQAAENEFMEIPNILSEIKEQGGSISQDFVLELYQSNNKHKEVIHEMLSRLTNPNLTEIQDILEKNEAIKKELDSLR
jgi:hypothetical protein